MHSTSACWERRPIRSRGSRTRSRSSLRGTSVEGKLESVYEEVTEIVYRSCHVTVVEQRIEAGGLPLRYLRAGEGPPLVLLHGAGDNSLDWKWVMPALARTHRVYAPDLPGSPDSARPAADYSPAFFERSLAAFLDALDIGQATFVGNSLGGLIALRLALSEPERAGALVLVNSAGLGRAINPAFTSVNVPGLGEAALPFWRTPLGAYQRAWGRTTLLFAHPPEGVPREWLAEQCRLALTPGYLEAHLSVLRALVEPGGQREVLADRLPLLKIPTLVVWGERDRVFPRSQAKEAVAQLPEGSLTLVPECGHMPHVECPDRFLAALDGFLLKRVHR
jgi:pimeloyl-ACP methyl ester carboxylesterase